MILLGFECELFFGQRSLVLSVVRCESAALETEGHPKLLVHIVTFSVDPRQTP